MKYSEIRSSLKSGDILVWTHRGWDSLYDVTMQSIRLATQSEYVHVGIVWTYLGRVFVIESVAPYVRIVPLSNLLPCFVLTMPTTLSKQAEEEAMKLVGKGRYSKIEAVKSLFKLNNSANKWQCVEFVKYIWGKDGFTFETRDVPSDLVHEVHEKYSGVLTYIEE